MSETTLWDKLRLGWALSSVVLSLAASTYFNVSQYGPRWLWLTDACPNNPDMSCGVMPLGPLLIAAPAAFIGMGGVIGITAAENRLEVAG